MKKRLILSVQISLTFLVAGILLFVLGCTTPQGLQTLFRILAMAVPGTLTVEAMDGVLLGFSSFEGIQYTDKGMKLTLSSVTFDPVVSSLFLGKPRFRAVHLGDLVIHATSSDEDDQGEVRRHLDAPFPLHIDTAELRSFTLYEANDPEPHFVLRRAGCREAVWLREKIAFRHMEGVCADVSFSLAGEIGLWKKFPLQVEVTYNTEVPGLGHVQGTGSLSGDSSLLNVHGRLQQPLPLHVKGRVHWEEGQPPTWNLQVTGDRLQLRDINPKWPDLFLQDLAWSGRGTFTDMHSHLQARARYGRFLSDSNISGSINLSASGLHVPWYRIEQGRAVFAGQGTLHWKEKVQWNTTVEATSVDPSQWYEQWPGTLAGTITVSGTYLQNVLETRASLTELKGTVRGVPCKAAATGTIKGTTVSIESAQVTSGESVLTLQGVIDGQSDLDFSLQSPELSQLVPGGSGALNIQGNIQGSLHDPILELQGRGDTLSLLGMHIQSLNLHTVGTPLSLKDFFGSLDAQQVAYHGVRLDRLHLLVDGREGESVVVHATLKDREYTGDLSLSLQYGLGALKGSVRELHVHAGDYGAWQLSDQAPFIHSSAGSEIQRLCLDGLQPDRVCLGFQQDNRGQWQVQMDELRFSLAHLQNYIKRDIPVDGVVEGQGTVSGNGTVPRKAHLQFHSQEAQLQPEIQGRIGLVDNVSASLQLDYEKQQLQAETGILFEKNGSLYGQAVVQNFNPLHLDPHEAFLAGGMQLAWDDISACNPLLAPIVGLEGALKGTMTVSGTLAQPSLHGKISLASAVADIFPLGIRFDPLIATLEGDRQTLNLSGQAHSGKGALHFSSKVFPLSGMRQPITIHLQGKDCTIVQNPVVTAAVSPDLEITLSPQQLRIEGDIVIPHAKITRNQNNTPIQVSKDVVIVDTPDQREKESWPLNASINITAGENVAIDAYGVRGNIQGQLEIVDRPHTLPVGNGTVQIKDGTFTLYGKSLDIDVGRLIFTGNLLDNPGLEVRSEKRDKEGTVGVNVGGFLKSPVIRLYSSTSMEQYEILAKLLSSSSTGGTAGEDTGLIAELAAKAGFTNIVDWMSNSKKLLHIDDIKVDTGNSFDDLSLIIGTWLTPRFYVSYGRNLLKESGSLNTRYTLGKGFSIQTETGTTQSGGDIKYEFRY